MVGRLGELRRRLAPGGKEAESAPVGWPSEAVKQLVACFDGRMVGWMIGCFVGW